MPTEQVNGINLYYESSGKGEPLLFIPGLGGTTDLWIFQTKYFKNHYQTISLDNRGAGRSDKPFGIYTMKMFADDLSGLLNALGIAEPVNLVGASMGGIIAQAFIHYYPERVKKLVLSCSGVSLGDSHITMCADYVTKKLLNPGSTVDEKINTYLEIFYYPEFVAANPGIKDLYLQRKIDPQPPYAYMAQLAACSDPNPYYEWLAEIKAPVLVIHGRDDIIWPLQNARTLKEGLGANGELYIVEKAAHVFMQEKPEEFNKVVHEFLKK